MDMKPRLPNLKDNKEGFLEILLVMPGGCHIIPHGPLNQIDASVSMEKGAKKLVALDFHGKRCPEFFLYWIFSCGSYLASIAQRTKGAVCSSDFQRNFSYVLGLTTRNQEEVLAYRGFYMGEVDDFPSLVYAEQLYMQ